MGLVSSIAAGAGVRQLVDRSSFEDGYPFEDLGAGLGLVLQQTLIGNREQIAPNYLAFVQQAYKRSPIIFACIANRMQLFSEARFAGRERVNGKPGELRYGDWLAPLERPWANGGTGDLLALAEVHNSLAGNFFCARRGDNLRIMRPDWTYLILGGHNPDGSPNPYIRPLDLDAEVVGYAYFQGGLMGGQDPLLLHPEEVCHWAPIPDPEVPFRGMSWITPVVEELLADKAMTSHRKKFMDGGATPNLAVKLNVESVAKFNEWVAAFREAREGKGVDVNPYRTLFLASAADPVPIGADLKQIDFAVVQSAGEVRIAAAAGVHPAVAAFTAGLQGSTLNAGNLDSAFRQFANGTMRPLWRSFAGAISTVLAVPDGQELWYDDEDVPALQEHTKDQVENAATDATTIGALIMAGFDPDTVIEAVTSKDFSRLLGGHTGMPSVQLQPAQNGNGKTPQAEPAPAPGR